VDSDDVLARAARVNRCVDNERAAVVAVGVAAADRPERCGRSEDVGAGMSEPPLDYRNGTQRDDARPQVRWQTIVSCSLLGMGIVCGLVAVVLPQRRPELISAAITLGIAGTIIYFPYVRM
jgi:hypothetical protein